MAIRKKHKLSLIGILFVLAIAICGCQSLPKRGDPKNTGTIPNVNQARLLYAAEINDKGFELKDYRAETGDVLNISVWQVEDLQKTVVVRPDGKISFPLIGDIQAQGVTIEELRGTLEEKLGKYIRVPQVSVIVEAFGGKRAVVIDESGGGGIIRFAEPIRIAEALAMAGGYNADVNLHKVYIIRSGLNVNEPSQIIVINAHKIFREADMRENILIHSDDIIFLARGWLSTLTEFIDQMDTFKTEINKVVHQANYYRNFDRIAPWFPDRTAIDFGRDKGRRPWVKGDWDIGDKN
ncbi:MAG: polysaccharide biosynthesis/export family protein [Candidatus Omnitrophica bacterium]|nr:polysaccharide biosynthesis/export family protein [Candidatus Omnitrophota bacterium]